MWAVFIHHYHHFFVTLPLCFGSRFFTAIFFVTLPFCLGSFFSI